MKPLNPCPRCQRPNPMWIRRRNPIDGKQYRVACASTRCSHSSKLFVRTDDAREDWNRG